MALQLLVLDVVWMASCLRAYHDIFPVALNLNGFTEVLMHWMCGQLTLSIAKDDLQ